LAPIALFYTDNTSSASWAAAVYAKTPRLRGLIMLYADMLEMSGIKPCTAYISSADNHQADFLSRFTAHHDHLSHPPSHHQVSRQYNTMISYQIFHPSSTLLSVIAARMYYGVQPDDTAHLKSWGHLEAAASTSSISSIG
jgi:hypothetical protein